MHSSSCDRKKTRIIKVLIQESYWSHYLNKAVVPTELSLIGLMKYVMENIFGSTMKKKKVVRK